MTASVQFLKSAVEIVAICFINLLLVPVLWFPLLLAVLTSVICVTRIGLLDVTSRFSEELTSQVKIIVSLDMCG